MAILQKLANHIIVPNTGAEFEDNLFIYELTLYIFAKISNVIIIKGHDGASRQPPLRAPHIVQSYPSPIFCGLFLSVYPCFMIPRGDKIPAEVCTTEYISWKYSPALSVESQATPRIHQMRKIVVINNQRMLFIRLDFEEMLPLVSSLFDAISFFWTNVI